MMTEAEESKGQLYRVKVGDGGKMEDWEHTGFSMMTEKGHYQFSTTGKLQAFFKKGGKNDRS